MSDKLPTGSDLPAEPEPLSADDYRLQISADNSCALIFLCGGVEVARIFVPAVMADSISDYLRPEKRRALWNEAREQFNKARH